MSLTLTLGDTMMACLLLSHQSSCDSPFSPSDTQKEETPTWPGPEPDPLAKSCTRMEELAWESARAISITAWLWRHPRSTEHSRPHMDSIVAVLGVEVVLAALQSPCSNCLAASHSLSLRKQYTVLKLWLLLLSYFFIYIFFYLKETSQGKNSLIPVPVKSIKWMVIYQKRQHKTPL